MGELTVPAFATPQPIVATLEVANGSVRVSASERADTVVEVRPRDPGSAADAEAAAHTRVEFGDGRLSITAPKRSLLRSLMGAGPAIEIDVALPEGSELDAVGWADYVCTGRLGAVALEKAAGIRIERAARVRASSSAGDIVVGRIDGPADLRTAMGKIRAGAIGGGSLKTSAGDVSVGEATAAVRLKTAYGDIAVDRALASVQARTSTGSVRVGEAAGGTLELDTAYGELEIGVPDGVAAFLDVSSASGTVRSELEASAAPAQAGRTVEIRGHTRYGGIVIRRA